MKKSKLVAATAMVSITGLAGSALAALPANAATHSSPRSLATVLTSDGNKFDKNGKDFDVVTEAVLAVLAAKPDSAVKGSRGSIGEADRVHSNGQSVPEAGK